MNYFHVTVDDTGRRTWRHVTDAMTADEIKQRRIEGARAFIKWIDECHFTIAKWDDELEELVPAGLTMAGYLNEFANHADLTTFMNRFRPDAVSASFVVAPINGGGDDQTNPGIEVSNP